MMTPDEHNSMAWLDSSVPKTDNQTNNSQREEKHLVNQMLNFLDQI